MRGKDEAVWWFIERIVGGAAEHMGRSYFGAIGAFLASVLAYAAFSALRAEAKPEREPVTAGRRPEAEPERKPDAIDRLRKELDTGIATLTYHLGIFLLFVAASALIGFGGAVLWDMLARLFPAVDTLVGERGPPIAWVVVGTIALAWFYRSSWKIVGIGLLVLGLVLCLALVRFGLLDDPFRWLATVAIAVTAFTLMWVQRSSWRLAIISVFSVSLGLYFLGHNLPLGALGVPLSLGGILLLILASPGVVERRQP